MPTQSTVSTASSKTFATTLFFAALKCVLRVALSLRYRVRVEGLESLNAKPNDKRPVLFLPSHSALVDPLIVYSLLADYRPRAVADARQIDRPLIRTLTRPLRPLIMPDMQKDGRDAAGAVRQVLDQAAASLVQGEACLLYPTGRLTRDGLDRVGGNSGAFSLYSRVPQCRVVLIRIRGLWGSSFSYASGHEKRGKGSHAPEFFRVLLRSIGRLFANGLLFMPRRTVRVVVSEATRLPPPEAGVLAFNHVLETFYQAEAQPIVRVPAYFWRGLTAEDVATTDDTACTGAEADLATGMPASDAGSHADFDPALRDAVFAVLAAECGTTHFDLHSTLAGDLGIDSLSLVNVALQLEERFGQPIAHLEKLRSVRDCLRAAAGQLGGVDVPQPPADWLALGHSGADKPLTLPSGATIPQLFVQQVRANPTRLLLGDASGALRRKDVLLRALALASALRSEYRKVERSEYRKVDRLGIMLPASSAAAVVWLAVLLAGKTPVLFNWTTGERNFRHCLDISGVRHVLTARKLMQRLEQQGFSPAVLTDRPIQAGTHQAEAGPAGWVYLEDMAAALPLRHKLWAAVQTGLVLLGLGRCILPRGTASMRVNTPNDTPAKGGAGECAGHARGFTNKPGIKNVEGDAIAAILFTSGSESRPKAVPLSHANILANCRDVAEVLGFTTADTMLGMLPPFHSLGLTGNIVVPLAFGMPIVYHPNPTEAAQLNALCRAWRPSVTVSPPTFLEGMLLKAQAGDVASLRLAFVGAEKCPMSVYQAFSAQTGGGVLCEGYGVTECAPGVCVNPPDAPRPGTIGLALPSVSLAVVVEGNVEQGDTAQGEAFSCDACGESLCQAESLRRAGHQTSAVPLRRAGPGEQGMLLIAGPNVFAGYLSPPVCRQKEGQGIEPYTTQPDDPFVTFEGRRWYRSGDLVSADATGHLTFRGRLKRFVKIGGEMLSLPQMEELLLTAVEAQRAGREGPLLALESCDVDDKPVIHLFTTVPLSREEANAILRAGGLSGLHAVHGVLSVQAIPVLGTGKTDYQSLKHLLTQK